MVRAISVYQNAEKIASHSLFADDPQLHVQNQSDGSLNAEAKNVNNVQILEKHIIFKIDKTNII